MKPKVRVKKQAVPGVLTFVNLFFGFLAIVQASQGRIENACWLILAASLFDAMDGPTARALKVTTPFGVEFDSIADVVSFCTAPAVLIYFSFVQDLHPLLAAAISFVPLISGAFRLARFNQVATGTPSPFYSGLPSTAFAVTLSAFVIFNSRLLGTTGDPRIALPLVLFLSMLMVSHLAYPKLTYIGKGWHSRIKVIFFLLSLAALTWWRSLVLFPLTMMYVIGGFIRLLFNREDMEANPRPMWITRNRKGRHG